jgi:hypothetical protein
MTGSKTTETITNAKVDIEASIKQLADAANGLVDKQAQLNLDNVTLFAQTALFVREMLADLAMTKGFIKLMETLDIKLPPDLKKIAGISLSGKETEKLGTSNMLLPVMRTIFHHHQGKLRSFENYAYPMTQLLKDDTLVTLDQLLAAIRSAEYKASGKTLTGIEALRAMERASRNAGNSRTGANTAATATTSTEVPMQVSLMKGLGQIPKEIASALAFNGDGFGIAVVRKAKDGSADILFGVSEDATLTELLAKGWQTADGTAELDPRFKEIALPEAVWKSFAKKEAA